MTDAQSHIVGTWRLNLSFSKGPLSSRRQVSPAPLFIPLSVIPPPIFLFFLSFPQPLSVSFIHLSLVAVIPGPCFLMACVGISNPATAPSLVFPQNSRSVGSLPPFLYPPLWNSLVFPPLYARSLVSTHLTACLFMPACRTEPRVHWPLNFIDTISSALTTTSGLIYLFEHKRQI